MNTIKKTFTYLKNLPLRYTLTGGVIIVVGAVVGVHFATRSAAPVETSSEVTHVQVASVASLSDQAGPLPLTGKVVSVNKANILAVSSGEIVYLAHALGDYVGAGSVIASFENSSQRAVVLQAQGAYDAATAALAKATGSTAQNSSAVSAQANQASANATIAAGSALRSAYASLDDAVHTKADVLFSNANQPTPHFNLTVPDSQLIIRIEQQRSELNGLLESVNALTANTTNTTSADMDTNITTVITQAQTVESFINDIIAALNKAILTNGVSASSLAGYQSSLSAARTEVMGAISSLTSAKATYDSAISGATVAANSADSGTANDIAVSQANLKSARGALDAAQANLEKTIIRAPISGTIVSLPITRGDYVSSFSQVAQISNPHALEIEAYVTSADAKTLVVGGSAMIGGTTKGVIVFIAPALDPTTGKIQIKIGVPGDQGVLTDGETVTLSLNRSTGSSAQTNVKSVITIPIVAAKITPTGPVVFTVSAGTSTTLIANPITFGPILGGQVTVATGISLDMDIVTDARGLSDGQEVIIDLNK